MADDLARLTPKNKRTEEITVATPELETQIVQRGTAQALKDVENPSRDDIEADFAFLNDILTKVGVSETPSRAEPAEAVADAPALTPRVSSVPRHVPHHKRGAAADKSKPVFAVQETPRSVTARTAAAVPAAEVQAPRAQTESPADIYDSIVNREDDAQLALPFGTQSPVAEERTAPASATVTEPVERCQTAPAEAPTSEAQADSTANSSEGELNIDAAFDTLGMRRGETETVAGPLVSFEADAPASREEIAPVRPSLFAKRPKASKSGKARVSARRAVETSEDATAGVVGGEPPALMRRLMSALPANEISQGVSEFAKARLAKDPFDRLVEEACRA